MIYQPKEGQMWDPSVLWHEGAWYAVMMHNPGGHFLESTQGLMATSPDGAHWQDAFVAVDERERSEKDVFCKAFMGRVNGGFFLNHGLARDGHQINDKLRFYRSDDLRHWTYLGDSTPDPRYYNTDGDVRWDHMYVLPKDEGHPDKGYWGYVTACPKEGYSKGLGMMESDDGFNWRALPPPVIEWGDITPANLEVGGCERINGRYYLICGWWRWNCEGYANYNFVSDDPCGPFRPDREAFKLCGSSTMPKSILACYARGKNNELLLCDYMNSPSGIWMLPLRKIDASDGHLRLVWWPENERLKDTPVKLKTQEVKLQAESEHQIQWLDADLDFSRGIILEGQIMARANRAPAFAGFAFNEDDGIVRELRVGIGETNRARTLTGRYTDIFGFHEEDTAGPACATLTAMEPEQTHTFRLLVRRNMFELYVNDRLVRTADWRPKPGRERLGFLAGHAAVNITNLTAHAMSLEGEAPQTAQTQGLNPI